MQRGHDQRAALAGAGASEVDGDEVVAVAVALARTLGAGMPDPKLIV